jgi:DNA excision repair protein ERCC-1
MPGAVATPVSAPAPPRPAGSSLLKPPAAPPPAPAPAPTGTVRAASRGLLVASGQKGNTRLLSQVRNVRCEFVEGQAADFVMGAGSGALFLSLRFHLLHPDYLATRAADVRALRLRVVLCHADEAEGVAARALAALSQLCVRLDLTLLVAWSSAEAARYLETLRAYDSRSAALIQARPPAADARLSTLLQEVRFINKTDAATLANAFGSFARVVRAAPDELALCPGLGARKLARLHDAFHAPLVSAKRPATQAPQHEGGDPLDGLLKRSRSGAAAGSPPSSP